MKTTIEHLIAPRFKVIADYPGAKYQVGDILIRLKGATNDWYHTEEFSPIGNLLKQDIVQYPHLFQPLKWWENRREDEMPKYLKIGAGIELKPTNYDYYEIHKWHMERLFGQVDQNRMSGCCLTSFNPEYTYQPCSEEEYLANQ